MEKEYAQALRTAFREEAQDLLVELEMALLGLEENPEDMEIIGRVFRALHTIKGSAGMAGFDEVSAFSHQIESLFDHVRRGAVLVDAAVTEIGLSAKDIITQMLAADEHEAASRQAEEIIEQATRLIGVANAGEHAASASTGDPEEDLPSTRLYRIRFQPSRDLFAHGVNPLMLLRELRQLGECHVNACTREIPELPAMDPEQCYFEWNIELATDKGLDSIKDVFIFVDGSSHVEVMELSRESGQEPVAPPKGPAETQEKRAAMQRASARLANGGLLRRAEKAKSVLEVKEHSKKTVEPQSVSAPVQTIRVGSDKLDSLMDLVGEIVTVQAALSEQASLTVEQDVVVIAEKMERLTADLRETAMGMRMVPIGSSFGRLRRLVHDLSQHLNKDVALITNGEDTELDKNVIERLNDPLLHLVRNAIDHGIESPEERIEKGKPRRGTVELTAAQSGGFVHITIRDDGSGLDEQKIVEKALSRGLLPPGSSPSRDEILNFIFLPGFSTAASLSEVSGRGVGMDVVKTTIEELRGAVMIDSEAGAGTTITLRIPLTLAIIEGLLVRISEERYIFPLSTVDECIEYSQETVNDASTLIEVRGTLIPFVSLNELFEISDEHRSRGQIVITQVDGKRVGFLVDEVVGTHQTVIKSLGNVYRNVEGVSGATILGNGSMALILDLDKLVRRVELMEPLNAARTAGQFAGARG